MTETKIISTPKDKITLVIILKTLFTWFLVALIYFFEFAFFIPIAIILTLLFDFKEKRIIFYITKYCIRFFFKLYVTAKFTFDFSNLTKPNKKTPRIYFLNHASLFDTFLMFLIPGRFNVFVKEHYTRVPFVGWVVLLNGNIIVKKSNTDEDYNVLEIGIDKLKKGNSLVIFPEGTKSKNGNIGRFKTGGFKMAYETKAEIVPIILDTWNSIRPGGGWIRDDRVWLKALPAYKYEEYKNYQPNEFSKIVRYKMTEELVNIRNQRRKLEKNYYRKHQYYSDLDNKAMENCIEFKNKLKN